MTSNRSKATSEHAKYETHPLTRRLESDVEFYRKGLDRAEKILFQWQRDWAEFELKQDRGKSNG